jgi:hypothetical protein
MIGGLAFVSIIFGVVAVLFLELSVSWAIVIVLALWLAVMLMFNFVVLGQGYKNVWNLFWHRDEGWGWHIKKWRDNIFAITAGPMAKDGKEKFEYKHTWWDGNEKKEEWRTDICVISGTEFDVISKAPVVISKQGVTETINLSANAYCETCGATPFEGERATQIQNDLLMEEYMRGRASQRRENQGQKQGLPMMIIIIGIVLVAALGYLIYTNGQAIDALQVTVDGLAKAVAALAPKAVITPTGSAIVATPPVG